LWVSPGFIDTHTHSDFSLLLEPLAESKIRQGVTTEVTGHCGVSLQISHLKCETPVLWGQADRLLQRIDRARDSGLHVDFDQYPYTAYSTGLLEIFPTWAKENGTLKTIQVLSDPKLRRAVVDGMTHPTEDWDNRLEGLDWDQIRIVGYELPANLVLNGLTVSVMAELRGQDPDSSLDPRNSIYRSLLEMFQIQ
jgi:N-acyl-D-amino-acid deacylase